MLYLLDANVLIRAHEDYYALDRVPQFWNWLLEIAESGRVKMPFEIYSEIAVSKGPLSDWICEDSNKQKLLLDEAVDPVLLNRVLTLGYAPDLNDNEIEEIGQDPFLVAYALASSSRVVVTKEVSKPSKKRANRKLPDVCNDLKVAWTKDFDFYRSLNFSTAGR